ncbi:hypothetical protein CSC70_03810 [Pseudoxanthomonas kalamensis DSM 18571]|uniref:HK97 gp10 family phage protein n=1 Tax=Pseudoxanthomonas kalamensis TaxID=289483 RepID=UPI0013910887|nr:HK97 gp10 family phage protein [Pseudoxanthomonas kalamensis]KAF1711063.1 hypothetical protein CSC70_03810 [Pseudoxanthomonas kalamensis DSM 18571]
MSSFAVDVGKWAIKSEKAVDQTVRAITFALFSEVIDSTPVDTGRLKGNWQVSVGSPASGTLTTTDESGAKTKANILVGMGGWVSLIPILLCRPIARYRGGR